MQVLKTNTQNSLLKVRTGVLPLFVVESKRQRRGRGRERERDGRAKQRMMAKGEIGREDTRETRSRTTNWAVWPVLHLGLIPTKCCTRINNHNHWGMPGLSLSGRLNIYPEEESVGDLRNCPAASSALGTDCSPLIPCSDPAAEPALGLQPTSRRWAVSSPLAPLLEQTLPLRKCK